jgi:lauroyl/myristoyl acyltransferase
VPFLERGALVCNYNPVMSDASHAPPHAPKTGRARRLLGDFHVTGVFWYRFHRWGASKLPEWLASPLILVFTTLFFLTIFNIRRAIGGNLAVVLGPCGWLERQRRIFRTMHAFAWCLTERYEHLATDRAFDVVPENREHWESAAARGGVVMVTAHMGNYEVGSMFPASKDDRHVHLVREKEVDPRAQEFVKNAVAAVEGSNYGMLFQSDDPLQGMQLLEALRRGEVVAMQVDRPRAGGKSIPATLFGHPFPLPAGPFGLARTAGVQMVPAFAIREGRRKYRAFFRPPITVPRTADRAADLAEAARRAAADIEWAVRRAPYQWFVFRKLWN